MTFGIDIATPQKDIDLARAKAGGVEFVIVKMGGLNVTPQYVAPYYRAQVDKAVAAGLPKGHYYLIGKGQTPEQQADYFVANLYRFDPLRDVLALDNESLDANGTKWSDADAARFAKRVLELTGIPAARFWHYAGASDYRAAGSWPQLVALGVRFWWAAYGSYPTGQTPDHQPDLQGSIPVWDVHQFTSKSNVAGYALDGNYTPHSVAVLFGGVRDEPREADMRLFANAVTNVWAVGGPGIWYTVPSALAGKFQEVYGSRIACTDSEFTGFKSMCLSAKANVDMVAIQSAIAAGFAALDIPEPDAVTFAKAVRAELAENPLR